MSEAAKADTTTAPARCILVQVTAPDGYLDGYGFAAIPATAKYLRTLLDLCRQFARLRQSETWPWSPPYSMSMNSGPIEWHDTESDEYDDRDSDRERMERIEAALADDPDQNPVASFLDGSAGLVVMVDAALVPVDGLRTEGDEMTITAYRPSDTADEICEISWSAYRKHWDAQMGTWCIRSTEIAEYLAEIERSQP